MDHSSHEPTRRRFLGQTGLALSAAAVAPTAPTAAAAAASAGPATKPVVPKIAPSAELAQMNARVGPSLEQTGWNVYSRRFVDAPTFTWKPLDGAAAYVVRFAHEDDKAARTVRLDAPTYDMTRDWPSVGVGCIDMIASAVDGNGQELGPAWRKRFYKSPGFDGVKQQPVDYLASIERNLAYLLAPARDKVEDFERGFPRSCWASSEESATGRRRLLSFPALHHPSFIFAYLGYARQFPDRQYASEAVHQAKQYGDWLLANRLPGEWRCGLFPFSTIQNGKTEGYIEGRNITLFRSARVGEAMVCLFKHFKDQQYLDYARHLADTYVALQRPDGSWPYRVDPKDGRVVEEYTSNAVTPARLLGLLEQIEPNASYAAAREKAAQWVMENPVRTRRWQGMYEDVGATVPYRNLEHWDANEMIRYLVHYRRGDAEAARVIEDLNRYIEDQFVVWRDGDRAIEDRCPAPTVLEQYVCYRPMESHTATWIRSLIALHRATGNDTYLTKAINAGNSIVSAQQESGAYSTWGYDPRFGRPLLTQDWTGCNAVAVDGLLQLTRYASALPTARHEEQPL
jgi:rhamnogalacturonyl hydrolase YesR